MFSRVYHAFADQLEEIVRAIRASIAERRYDVGQRALGVYGAAKSINRPNQKPLIVTVGSMRRTLGRGLKKPAEKPVDGTAPPTEEGGATTLKK